MFEQPLLADWLDRLCWGSSSWVTSTPASLRSDVDGSGRLGMGALLWVAGSALLRQGALPYPAHGGMRHRCTPRTAPTCHARPPPSPSQAAVAAVKSTADAPSTRPAVAPRRADNEPNGIAVKPGMTVEEATKVGGLPLYLNMGTCMACTFASAPHPQFPTCLPASPPHPPAPRYPAASEGLDRGLARRQPRRGRPR